MSFAVNYKSIDEKLKKKIISELKVKGKKTQYNDNPPIHKVYELEENILYLPIRKYSDYFEEKFSFPHKPKEYPRINVKFSYALFTKETDPSGRGRDQDVVSKEAIKQLEKNRTTFISAFTGFGKSLLGTYLLCHLKYKTMILCHNDVIKEQWKDEIIKFTGGKAKVQIVKGKNLFDEDADVYIAGIQKASKFSREELLTIGLVIIDEAHICTITAFTKSLLKFQPMYIVGLSATPERLDGLHTLLEIYFGPSKDFIKREEVKKFKVIKYKTKYVPEISYQYVKGRMTLAWTDIITSLSIIEDRWKEIAEIAISEPDHKIILLCDRQKMAESIYDYLINKGESVELLIGSKKKWDKSKRILVAGAKKGGVGLNDPDLTMLILAADMKNVKQCEGRIRTTDNIVYDVVDNYKTFETHWKIREKWYLKRGATIVSNDGIESEDDEVTVRYLKSN